MKKTHKILSILLAVAMLLTMAPLSLTASAAANDKVFIGNALLIQLKGNAATIEAGSKANFTKIKIGNEYIDFSKCKYSSEESIFTLGDSNYEADLSGTDICGAQFNSMTGDVNITMTGGVVKKIIGSCSTSDAVLTGNVNITMTGGKVNEIWGAEYGVDGNVNITVTGGTVIDAIYIMYRNTTITGDGNVIITGGSSCTIDKVHTYGNIKGSTNLYSTLLPYGYAKDNFTNFVYSDGSNWKFGGNTATALKGNTLTIASGQTATVDSGKTLSGTIVNNGTINVKNGGTLSGTVTNNGTIFCYGNINGVTNSGSGKIIKKVTASGTNVAFNDSAWQNNKTNYDDAYDATLTPASGYALPASVTVNVGGTTLAESAYTYNVSTGALSIPSAKITTDTTVSASAPINLSDSANSITLEQSEYTYTGSAFTPALMVNGVKANANDYTAEYSDNTNVGTATVTVTGKNSYVGTKTLTFEILPASIGEATVTLGDSLTYNGATQTQTVKSVTVNGITLTEGIDYTISDNTAKDAGTYTLTITGINNAVGTITKNWKIAPKSATTSATVQDKVYDGTTTVDASTVSIIFDGIVDGDDVKVESVIAMFKNANAGNNKTVIVAYKAVGEDVANYEIYKDGVKIPESEYYYIETKANILPRDIADAQIVLGDALTYNSAEQTQSIASVTVDGLEVTYTVSGNTAKNVGVYQLTVTGTGNFTGEAKITFEIAVDMNGVDFDRLHPLNVKATDKEKIEYIYNQLDNAFRDYADAEKRNEWDNNKSYCVELFKMIESVANHIESFENDLAKYDINTVTSDDDADLESLEESIGYFYDYYFDNLTEEQEKKTSDIFWAVVKLEIRISDIAKEIKRLIAAANGYDEATVTSADMDALVQLNDDIYALALTENVTAEEKANLQAAHDKVLGLLDKLVGISDEIKRIIEAVDKYVFESVKSSDKADIQQLIADIKALLDTQNLTADERTLLETADETCDKLVAKIDETVAEINRIDEATNAYDESTVTSADKEAIEQLIADIKALTDGDNITESEREQLVADDETLDALLAKIKATADEIARIEEAVNGYDEATVKSTDKADLEQLKEDIQALIDSTNTTENEKTVLEDMIKDTEGLEAYVEEIENQLEEIKDFENDYNSETVTSDDKADIEEKIAEIEAVNPDNLTEEQKAEYDEIKADLEALIEEIEKAGSEVDVIGSELEMFDEERVTIFYEDEIEALKAKIDELLADENMGEAEKAKLNEYKAQCDNLVEIINTPAKYFSMRMFYFVLDAFNWLVNRIAFIF